LPLIHRDRHFEIGMETFSHSHNLFVQGLNTLKYVMEADDDVFDVGADDTPILSLVILN
jgi:hypothetical protein